MPATKVKMTGNYIAKSTHEWEEADYLEWRVDMGKRLRRGIEKHFGYRQEGVFAETIGVSQGSLSDIVNGLSTPSATTLLKIAQHSKISVAHILWGYK